MGVEAGHIEWPALHLKLHRDKHRHVSRKALPAGNRMSYLINTKRHNPATDDQGVDDRDGVKDWPPACPRQRQSVGNKEHIPESAIQGNDCGSGARRAHLRARDRDKVLRFLYSVIPIAAAPGPHHVQYEQPQEGASHQHHAALPALHSACQGGGALWGAAEALCCFHCVCLCVEVLQMANTMKLPNLSSRVAGGPVARSRLRGDQATGSNARSPTKIDREMQSKNDRLIGQKPCHRNFCFRADVPSQVRPGCVHRAHDVRTIPLHNYMSRPSPERLTFLDPGCGPGDNCAAMHAMCPFESRK